MADIESKSRGRSTRRRRFQFGTRWCLIVIFLVAVLLGVAKWRRQSYYQSFEPNLTELFGYPAGRETVANAETVEVYRLGPLPPGVTKESAGPQDYPVLYGPIVLESSTARRLSHLLRQPENYLWHLIDDSEPEPSARVRFARGEREVWLDFDLQTGKVLLHTNGPRWFRFEEIYPVPEELVDILSSASAEE